MKTELEFNKKLNFYYQSQEKFDENTSKKIKKFLMQHVFFVNLNNRKKFQSLSDRITNACENNSSNSLKINIRLKRSFDSKFPQTQVKKQKPLLTQYESEILESTIKSLTENGDMQSFGSLIEALQKALDEHNIDWRNVQDDEGLTIFHYLQNLPMDVIDKILKGADKENLNNRNNKKQETPLFYINSRDLFIKLLDCGANVYFENLEGRNIFHELILEDEISLIELLVDRFPEIVNISCTNGIRPLFYAIKCKNNELITFLHQKGADPFVLSNGINVVYEAACTHEKKILDTVLSLNEMIDVNLLNMDSTAFHLACKFDDDNAMNLLFEAGADINIPDKDGIRPLQQAIYTSFNSVLKLLSFKVELDISGNTVPILCGIENSGMISEPDKTLLKKILRSKGVEIDSWELRLNRTHLANVWGIGTSFFFVSGNQEINYEGGHGTFATKRLLTYVENYFPTLESYYCFSDKVKQKILQVAKNMVSNQYPIDCSRGDILTQSFEVPQIILHYEAPDHLNSIVIYNNNSKTLLAFCDRADDESGDIQIHELNSENLSSYINLIRSNLNINLTDLKEISRSNYVNTLKVKPQKMGNCYFANTKAALYTSLVFLSDEFNTPQPEKTAREIYKALTSSAREQELKNYFLSIQNKFDEVDWFLLSRIYIQLQKKLRSTNNSLQKENFIKAKNHFDQFIKEYQFEINSENAQKMIHFFIALQNMEKIQECLNQGVDIHKKEGNASPFDTALKTKNKGLIDFFINLKKKEGLHED